jgi:hypothetical protein
MFASKSVLAHLVRGAIGLAALTVAAVWSEAHPWLLFLALPIALLALRGCPLCWSVGLVETLANKLTGRSGPGACTDGSCARTPAARE